MIPTSDTVKSIQTALNLWLGSSCLPQLAIDGNTGQLTQAALSNLTACATSQAGVQTPWTWETDGADLVVRNVIVTAFGGGHDAGDDGQTESGVMNDGSNPDLMGCALPVKISEAATRCSRLAVVPQIPWGTKVRFWLGADETTAIETKVIDNGPDVARYPAPAGDLTVAVAAKFAPEIPLIKLADNFEAPL